MNDGSGGALRSCGHAVMRSAAHRRFHRACPGRPAGPGPSWWTDSPPPCTRYKPAGAGRKEQSRACAPEEPPQSEAGIPPLSQKGPETISPHPQNTSNHSPPNVTTQHQTHQQHETTINQHTPSAPTSADSNHVQTSHNQTKFKRWTLNVILGTLNAANPLSPTRSKSNKRSLIYLYTIQENLNF